MTARSTNAVGDDDRSGQVVVITGSSKGLGRAMARGFGAAGATVVVSSRDQQACERVVEEITSAGGNALAVAAHVGRPEQLESLVEVVADRFGRIDVVVNNAAVNPIVQPLVDVPAELMAKLFAANVGGPLLLSRLALPHIPRGGCVLNITSRAAGRAEHGLGVYAATKAALTSLTQAMALEWAEHGVRVNAIAPGPFATVMVNALFDDADYRETLLDQTAQRRIAEPDEIVGAALYLSGPSASFVTGATLNVDGGMFP